MKKLNLQAYSADRIPKRSSTPSDGHNRTFTIDKSPEGRNSPMALSLGDDNVAKQLRSCDETSTSSSMRNRITELYPCYKTSTSSSKRNRSTEPATGLFTKMFEGEARRINPEKTNVSPEVIREESQDENMKLHNSATLTTLNLSLMAPASDAESNMVTADKSPEKRMHSVAFCSEDENVSTDLCLSDKTWTSGPKTFTNNDLTSGSFAKEPKKEAQRVNLDKLHQEPKEVEHITNQNRSVSTELTLFLDPWTIKKNLRQSDIGNQCRLLISAALIQDHVIPLLSQERAQEITSEKGLTVTVWDNDTNTAHRLTFKKWKSKGYYVFVASWRRSFVVRRNLKAGDEVGLYWDPFSERFNFSVLKRRNH